MTEWSDRFNPFNSEKLYAQLYRWSQIKEGDELPPPALVTVDPVNGCDLDCVWCNAENIMEKNRGMLNYKTLDNIARFLGNWKKGEWGVDGVCIAGGGEPLLHPYAGIFMKELVENGVEPGVVTNGTHIDRHIPGLSRCTWVGVSVDAGTRGTYERLKKKDRFEKVLKNIQALRYCAEMADTELAQPGRARGISYKFLLHPGNAHEVYEAAKIARDIGCRNMHIRPAGIPWDKVGKQKSYFDERTIGVFREQLGRARDLETDDFRVFGITHKFDGSFERHNPFRDCYAVFMTGLFSPSTAGGNYDFGLCCDRRGDERLTYVGLEDVEEVRRIWGSQDHWRRAKEIKVGECPRCTYRPHNQIYEKAIKEDNLSYKHI